MDKELLHKYFKGCTTADEEKQIMDWAEASSENYAEYLKERKMWNALLIYSVTKSSETRSVALKKRTLNLWKVVSIAASFALLTMIGWMQLGVKEDQQAGMQAVLVPAGQRVQLVLEDGTKVWLNSKSEFTYPTSFGGKTREVTLKGEGFFEVARDEKKPFIVKTTKYDVKVLGTTFNVYAYDNVNGTVFETSLLHGSVDVVSNQDIKQHIILKTKESVSEVNGLLRKGVIDNLDRFRWKDGLICLDDVPFGALMDKFSIYYDTHIQIENSKLLNYRCTGKFRQSDGLEYALKVIQKDLNFKFVRDSEKNSIIIK